MKENGYVCNTADGAIDLLKDGKLEEVSCTFVKIINTSCACSFSNIMIGNMHALELKVWKKGGQKFDG